MEYIENQGKKYYIGRPYLAGFANGQRICTIQITKILEGRLETLQIKFITDSFNDPYLVGQTSNYTEKDFFGFIKVGHDAKKIKNLKESNGV